MMSLVVCQATPSDQGIVLGANGNFKEKVGNECVVVRAFGGKLVKGIIEPDKEYVK